MATISPPRITPQDLLSIDDRPMPEFVDGEFVKRDVSNKSDSIGARLIGLLSPYVWDNNLGWINGAQGSYQIFPDDPNKVRIPDGSFTRRERLPEGPTDGHGRVAPDLVFDVISPNDNADNLEQKVADYLAAGIPLIWVISPTARSVRVIRGDGTGFRLKDGDVLDGGEVLAGFRCPVTSLFPGPAGPKS